MSDIIRGFHGRRTESRVGLPPGQHPTAGFPVLQAGPISHIDLDKWRFTIRTESGAEQSWTWAQPHLLPKARVDIRCVTSRPELGTRWDVPWPWRLQRRRDTRC
ncbi:hypothetical protein AB0C34_23560 [Nocardia sp. NPDC049220]|uniref:hypothetical protein n=1 Tax=Nocardia sp. NPDC049220 TaxID=3155273 RepID=UPI0033C2A8CE